MKYKTHLRPFLLLVLLTQLALALRQTTDFSSTTKVAGNQGPTLAQKVSFLAYTAKFSKNYQSTAEFSKRFQIWLDNDKYIKDFTNSQVQLQHNKFSDWTSEERDRVLNRKLADKIDLPDVKKLQRQPFMNNAVSEDTSSPQFGQASPIVSNTACPVVGCRTCATINRNFCTSCNSAKMTISSSNICVCTTGPMLPSGADCNTCPTGQFYQNNTRCVSCGISNCNTCTSTTRCTACASPFVVSAGQCVCPTGQRLSGSTCVACPQNCTACTTTGCSACISTNMQIVNGACVCPSGTVLNSTNVCATALSCPAGTYNLANVCTACPTFCSACINATTCTSCSDSTMRIVNVTDAQPCRNCDTLFQNVKVGLCRCGPETYLSGGKCVSVGTCSTPSTFNSGSTNVCTACAAGCFKCHSFTGWCYETTDPSVLINTTTGLPQCLPTQYFTGTQCITITQCPGAQWNNGRNVCSPCPTNCSVCANLTGTCITCANTFTMATGSTTCGCQSNQFMDVDTSTNTGNCITKITCPSGQYNPGWNNCTNCVSNCQTCSDVTGQCTQCNPTYTRTGNSCACNPNPQIQFLDSSSNLCVTITACPAGQYNNGQNTCNNCPLNCSSCAFATGACTACSTGFVSNAGQTGCNCVSGKYWTSNSGSGSCATCPTNCPTCSDLTGACLTCVNNLNVIAGTPDTCGCPTGQYLSGNTCRACPTNCTACSTGTGACTSCTSTFSLTSGACACNEALQTLISGQCVAILACNNGYYNPGNNICLLGPGNCNTVTYRTGVCSNCNPTFTYFSNNNTCGCAAGFYLSSLGICQACPQNCSYCTSPTVCTACKSTFTLASGACNCVANTEALVGGASCAALSTCPAAQYNDGTNTCRSCSNTLNYCGTCSAYTGFCTACLSTFQNNTQAVNSAGVTVMTSCGCFTGQYLDTTLRACVACPQNCSACDATRTCSSCMNNLTLTSGACACASNQLFLNNACQNVNTCVATTAGTNGGYYANTQNVCVAPSVQYCLNSTAITGVCTRCQGFGTAGALVLNSAAQTCTCPLSNQYIGAVSGGNDAFCYTCSSTVGCQNCTTGNVCMSCVTGYYLSGNTCNLCTALNKCNTCTQAYGQAVQCTACRQGWVLQNGACNCPTGYYRDQADNCNSCQNYGYNCGTNGCRSYTDYTSTDYMQGYCGQGCTDGWTSNHVTGWYINWYTCSCNGQYNTPGYRYPVPNKPISATIATKQCQVYTSCPNGQYNNYVDNECRACADTYCPYCQNPGVNQYTQNGVCQGCIAPMILSGTTCICPVSAGFYRTTSFTCAACPTNCARCADTTGICTACNTGFSLPSPNTSPTACVCDTTGNAMVLITTVTPNTCVAATVCAAGNYNIGGSVTNPNTCAKCPTSNCQTCTFGTGACTACNNTFVFNGAVATTAVNYCICASTQYQIASGFCVNCPTNCSACANLTGSCTTCIHSSFTLASGACSCPSNAPALAGGQCRAFLTNCGTGRYDDGTNTCQNCPANCNTCSNILGVCQTGGCVTSFTLNTTSNTCSCLSNQYLSNGACVNCPANCTLCNTAGQCTACTSTYTLTSGACACTSSQAQVSGACTTLNSCPSGQYNPGNNVCTNCPSPYCATCTVFTGVCTACNATFQNPTSSLNSACACLSNQYVTPQTTCASCPRNCNVCNSAGACTTCASTFTVVSGQCACLTTEYLTTSNVCATCPTNCTSCSDLTAVCQTCRTGGFTVNSTGSCSCPLSAPAVTSGGTVCAALTACNTVTNGVGQYNDGTNTCRSCPAFCTSCDNYSGRCNTCFSSFTFVSASNTCACTSSQYQTASNTCVNCAANCTTCAASTGFCTGCVATFTRRNNGCSCNPTTEAQVTTLGITTCVPLTSCSAGQYNPGNNVCVNCPDQYCRACNDYTGVCNACKDVSFTLSSGTCVCSSTQYINADGVCTNCPLNCTACSGPSGSCTSCTATFSQNTPSAGQCGCAPATPAVVTNSGTGVRTCAAMTVCSTSTTPPKYNPGTNVCSNCPTNSAGCSDWTGIITSCISTFTNNNPTSNTCSCQSNQYISASNQCVNCPANCTTCAATTGYCSDCVSTYSRRSNGCSCNPTTEALVTTFGVTQCTTLATCPAGQYNPGNNVCTNCATANCAACDAYTGQCSICALTFSLTTSFTCSCTSSQFLNTTSNRCQNCPQNCTACSATACTTCGSTFGTPTAGVCKCPTTQYLIASTGLCTNKVTCAAGQYNDGQNNCLSCSVNCTSCSEITGLCSSSSCVSTFTFNSVTSTCTCTATQALVTNGATGVTQCQSVTTCPNGQFNPGTNICKICPSNCTQCLSPTGVCTTCAQGFSLNFPVIGSCGCRLTQAFVNGQCTALTACTQAGTYNPGTNKCQACPANCTACSTPSGACTACSSGFTWNPGKGTCSCKTTQAFMAGLGCVPLAPCNLYGPLYNPGNNQCAGCSSNCVACADFTGRCTACRAGFALQSGSCVAQRRILDQDCQYAVGPVGKATICLSEPASDTRVVPEFNQTLDSIDWRTWGIVGGVKDQGTCGGDFAFSTTAAAETAYAIKTGKLLDLSEQYLIDCDVGSFGCQGGYQSSASLLLATDGAVLEVDYPYVGKQTGCRSNVVKKVFQLEYPGSVQVSSSKDAFKAQLRKGPLNISFRVSDLTFFFYGNGILPAELCAKGNLNHAMLAVGFGVEDSVEYALIQNQWGAGWGENGLIRVELTDDNEGPCGLYLQNSYTLV